jgi:molybdopterin molybdotransferase
MADARERVLRYEEALGEVLRTAEGLSTECSARPRIESVPLLQARGRVLAERIEAERDQPPFPRSTRDGFALRAEDVRGEDDELRVLGMVRAGERWTGAALVAHQAIEIMTGAPIPEGTDAVLMVEHAQHGEDGSLRPEPGRRLSPGENVVAQGAEAKAGAEVVPAGRSVGAAEVALAASCGHSQLAVYSRAQVAILATGDELVELTETPEPSQIRNSNSYALAALVEAEGGEAIRLPIARDNAEDLRMRIAEGRQADLLLLSGGVSMGKYDLVEQALAEAGAEFLFTGARIQPGRPVVFGRLPRTGESTRRKAGESGGLGWTYFFGLPGNPISTEVCFRLFVTPVLRGLCGRTDLPPRFAEAKLAGEIRGAKVTRFLPAEITGDWSGVSVRLVPWHGSGDLAANGRANGFVVLPMEAERFTAGETVRVLLR